MKREIAGPIYKRVAVVRLTVRMPKYRKVARRPSKGIVYKPMAE